MKKLFVLLCFCLFTAGVSARKEASGSAHLQVSHLTVEHMQNPAVIDTPQPRFSWINEPKDECITGEKQTAYRIVVASSERELKRGNYDLWDSGHVRSERSVLVPYAGKPLMSGQDYYWRVQTWDSNGKASKWSSVAHWGMGLLKAADWKAQWITAHQQDGVPLFRKAFPLSGKVRKAKAYVTAGGYFELYVNGNRVGEDYFVPNFTNYTERQGLDKGIIALDPRFTAYRILYLSYDITALLHKGKNAVGAMLGDGFYRSTSYHVGSFGEPCLLCQLEITYDDGTREVVATDESWLTHPSAITMNGVYDGEVYDARLETPHWAEVDCDETGWKHVSKAIPPTGELTAHTSPTDRITSVLQPRSITRRDSVFVVTFDQEIAGWVRLKNICGHVGQRVDVKYISESPLGRQEYYCKGAATESYAPRFTWFVFSQVEVSGLEELSASQIQAEAVNTNLPINAEFNTSNPLINRIYDMWMRSQQDNMHGCIASDCPHRERLPYTGDGQIAAAMVMLNFDAAAFYQKWVRDMRDAQNSMTGYVPNGAPWEPTCGGGVAWGAALNTISWEYYLQYGDRRMLELAYRPMRAQLSNMLTWLTPDSTMYQQMRSVETGQLSYWLNLGDWVPPYGMPADEIVHTFYLWLCATNAARTAQVLGDIHGCDECQAIADRTWRAFHRKFYDVEHRTYGDFGPNILALYMGVPDDRREAVVEALRQEIMTTYDGHINTGFVISKFFFETLSDCGLHDVATTAMLKTDYPSYGHWLEQGATVTWEQWDGQNSHNHPMFGGALTWFARRLAGINVTPFGSDSSPATEGAGYRHFEVRPFPTQGVDSVFYSLVTPQGLLTSRVISHKGQLCRLELRVPVGSIATVILPTDTVQVTQGFHVFNFNRN